MWGCTVSARWRNGGRATCGRTKSLPWSMAVARTLRPQRQTLFTAGGQVSLQFTGLTQGYARSDLKGLDVLAHEKDILDVQPVFMCTPAGSMDGCSTGSSRARAAGARTKIAILFVKSLDNLDPETQSPRMADTEESMAGGSAMRRTSLSAARRGAPVSRAGGRGSSGSRGVCRARRSRGHPVSVGRGKPRGGAREGAAGTACHGPRLQLCPECPHERHSGPFVGDGRCPMPRAGPRLCSRRVGVAQELGSTMLAVLIRGDGTQSTTTQRHRAADRLRASADLAARQGVVLAIEPMIDLPDMLLPTFSAAVDFVHQVSHPGVKLIFDTGHVTRMATLCNRASSTRMTTSPCCSWPICLAASSRVPAPSTSCLCLHTHCGAATAAWWTSSMAGRGLGRMRKGAVCSCSGGSIRALETFRARSSVRAGRSTEGDHSRER